MSLSASEQQALDSIEATLTSSDPKPRSTGHLVPMPAFLNEKVPSDLG